jgi:hypothetical protein
MVPSLPDLRKNFFLPQTSPLLPPIIGHTLYIFLKWLFKLAAGLAQVRISNINPVANGRLSSLQPHVLI